MREIILDTETTGLDPKSGHRLIEIGCLEMVNLRLTGQSFQTYINPERDVPLESTRISGITTDFLAPFPVFEKVVVAFLDFIQDSQLVIHNARFDLGFINSELNRSKRSTLTNTVVDTLQLARKLFPGSPANLDALCKRFQVDRSARHQHGALIDSQLLAQVYIELRGGRQRKLFQEPVVVADALQEDHWIQQLQTRPVRPVRSLKGPCQNIGIGKMVSKI